MISCSVIFLYTRMKHPVALIVLGVLAGLLSAAVVAEDCKSKFSPQMCQAYCMIYRVTTGQCQIVDGEDKCLCDEQRGITPRSLSENDEVARTIDPEISHSEEYERMTVSRCIKELKLPKFLCRLG
ncbi:hypothetical protein JTE90_025784 [Oedothorax gibbosus]|uniref:Uncharacterized protein n=1 Tax=Oedothorax gibbosus TaxID=931172 RepID=A0AAV6V1P6_9ARAC|nr:hypothetical protein JTE90_025784 [Oedothorax gibbosus]